MAQVTRKLNLTKSAYVKQASPNTVFPTSAGGTYYISRESYSNGRTKLLLGFAAWPSSLKRNRLIAARVRLRVKVGKMSLHPELNVRDFTPSSVTWNNYPAGVSNVLHWINGDSLDEGGRVWQDVWSNIDSWTAGDADDKSDETYQLIMNAGAVSLEDLDGYYPSEYRPESEAWYAGLTLGNGSLPYIEVTYDDSVMVTSKVSPVTYPSYYDDPSPAKAISFTWEYVRNGDYRCANEVWTQASAKLQYRKSGTSSWTTISVTGTTCKATIPKNTLDPATTYEWRIQGTDTDGTTTTTSVSSFTTDHSVVTPATYPSTPANQAAAQKFTWTLPGDRDSSTSYTQASARFYWRVSGASTYNQIAISGSTKAVTVQANTFPSGTTIQWYVQATDTLGYTSTSSVKEFTTMVTSLALSSFPAGANIDTRSAILFSWTLTNPSGAVPQSAAKLFWRVQDTGSYTQISYTGTTKSITAPANTFPTAKTIQWYVTVTDASGNSQTSAVKTFTTVSTRVTLDSYPSGNNVYTAEKIRFTWHLASNVGNYTQASAKLYWRTNTAQAWNTRSVSGNNQYMDVPANTFPTNSTVQWYLESTDSGGLTTQTNTMSFRTATTQITAQNSPTSGYSDPRLAIKFSWYFASVGGAVPQGSATFYWRVRGTESWTSVPASGATTSVTIPANTFPVASTIEWYVSGTDTGGTSSTSPVYSFSTAAETAYAYPQSPIGVTVDTGKAVTLHWILSNADGTKPFRVELSWKHPTDVSWTVIRTATTAFTSWTVDAGYFPVGEIEWRVIATNRDGIAGPAGTAAFISLRAPDAPVGLAATAVPRTTIRWQGQDQEAYEIFIDGESVQQAYGSNVSEWTPDFVLEDGIHVIAVRIQGPYGLWSEVATTTIDVQNAVPEGWEDLAISGTFDVDAALTMSGAESPGWVTANWYRDGKRIAVTHGAREYEDRYVLGQHSWFVELWTADGNYARSNVLTGTLRSCITRIALFEGGGWLDLKLSENSASEQRFRHSRTSSARHVLGRSYPILELSEFEDLSGSYDCAFRTVEEAEKLEAMRGKVVILKSRGGRVLIGLLSPLETRYTDFYISFSFTVQTIDWEDFRDV